MQRVLELMVRSLYLPLFLLVGNGVAVFWISEGHQKIWLIGWMCLFIGLSFLVEKLVPYDVVFNHPVGDKARDICHAIVNESLTVVGLWVLPVISGSLTVISFGRMIGLWHYNSSWPYSLLMSEFHWHTMPVTECAYCGNYTQYTIALSGCMGLMA